MIYRLVTVIKIPSQSEFILSLDEFGNRYYCGDKDIATTLLKMFVMNLIQKFEKKNTYKDDSPRNQLLLFSAGYV